MSLFNFKKIKSETKFVRKDVFAEGNINRSNFKEMLSACLGEISASLEEFLNYVKNEKPFLDYESGIVSFGLKQFPFQFIGTEYINENKWVWAYKNDKNINVYLLKLALETKKLGMEWNLDIFKSDNVDLINDITGENIATIVAGIKQNQIFYKIENKDKKTIDYIVVLGTPSEVFKPLDEKNFLRICKNSFDKYTIDHKKFVESFLLWNGTPYSWNGTSELIAHFKKDILFSFEMHSDGSMKILDINDMKKRGEK